MDTRQEQLLAHRQLQSPVVGIEVMFVVGLGTGHTLPGQGQMVTDHPATDVAVGASGPMPPARSSGWRSSCPNVNMSVVDLVLADKW